MADNGIKKIDLVVLNLYAFEDTVAKGYNFETCIENIDIAEGLIKEENMPNRFKEKDDWRKICLECERHD